MTPVYARGPIMGASPICFVTEDQRKEFLENGSGRVVSVNGGKAIHLLLNLEQIRGTSAQMGPSVTIKATFGSKFHREVVAEWQQNGMVGSYCPLELVAS